MSREVSNSNSQTVESIDDLLQIFVGGGRSPDKFKIGMEVERFLVDAKTSRALPFDGDRGVEKFLSAIASLNPQWTKVLDQGRLISLNKGETAITLEPGGQVEMSCRAFGYMADLYKELDTIDQILNKAASTIGAIIIARGIHPVETIETNPWMPKSRYKWMREYYEKRGRSAFEMMLLTASIQVNFDYIDEKDAAKKVFVSSFVSPTFAAMFANSPIEQGKPSGYLTRRIPIWAKTDPDRCGIPDFFVDGTFSFEKYRDFALDVPMYFTLRNGQYVDVKNMTFREFLKSSGGEWGPVTLGDWEFHLTTLFLEVRLKNHLEFRTVDSNSLDLVVALATFWKGLFHNSDAVDYWFQFFKSYGKGDLDKALNEVSRVGLAAKWGSEDISTIARELLEHSETYLKKNAQEEIKFLQPVKDILETGRSPALTLLKQYQGPRR